MGADRKVCKTLWMVAFIILVHCGIVQGNEARGSFIITAGGVELNISLKGNEGSAFYESENGYDVDWDPTQCNGSTSDSEDCQIAVPCYSLPNASTSGVYLTLDNFLLLPGAFLDHLLIEYPDLKPVLEHLDLRLDQFLDLNTSAAQDLWDEVVGKPLLSDFIELARTLIGNGTVLNTLTASAADVEWLVGEQESCEGLSKSERSRSSKWVCSGGILNNPNVSISRNTSGGGITLFGGETNETEDGSSSENETSTTPEPRQRRRRATCQRDNPYDPWFLDKKGPYTSDQADYRVRKQLIIPIRFSDHTARNLPTQESLDELFNCRGGCSAASSSGSVRDYFLENSYSRADVISYVTDWVALDNTESHFSGNGGYGTSSLALTRLCSGMKSAMESIITRHVDLNWRDFVHDCNDKDNSGQSFSEIEEVGFITSGYPAEFSSGSSAYRIWSHRFQYYSTYCGSTGLFFTNPTDGTQIKVSGYFITNGCYGDGSDGDSCPNMARLGVIAHEMGHTLLQGVNVLDYYETSSSDTTLPDRCGGTGSGKGIDQWGLMGDSWGKCNDQIHPTHLTAWSKIQFGWIDSPIQINTSDAQRYELHQAAQCPDALQVMFGYTGSDASTEFLIMENRQAVGIDSALPGTGGVVYHIDQALSARNSKPDWTEDNAHYYIRVEQADGADNLECGSNDADSGDSFSSTGSSITNKQLSVSPYYSTRGYTDNSEVDTGVTLTVAAIGTSGRTITVDYTTTQSPTASPTTVYQYPTTCAAGTYGSRDGNCVACPVGKYNPSSGGVCNSACQLCPDGKYTDMTGSTSCSLCPIGTYDDIGYYPSNSSSCVTCDTSSMSAGTVPMYTQSVEFCESGSFSSYTGGAYNEYTSQSINCDGAPTFLGLTQEQWFYVMYGIIGLVCLLVFWQLMSQWRLRRRKAAEHSEKQYKPRQVRVGHGYGAQRMQQAGNPGQAVGRRQGAGQQLQQTQPPGNRGQPVGNRGQPAGNRGQPAGNRGQPARNRGQPAGNRGQPVGQAGAVRHVHAANGAQRTQSPSHAQGQAVGQRRQGERTYAQPRQSPAANRGHPVGHRGAAPAYAPKTQRPSTAVFGPGPRSSRLFRRSTGPRYSKMLPHYEEPDEV